MTTLSFSPAVAARYGATAEIEAPRCITVKATGVGIYARLREGALVPVSGGEGYAHYLREAFTCEITRGEGYPHQGTGQDVELDDQEWCETHGLQRVVAYGTYTGYAGSGCSWWTMTCGCGGCDESGEMEAAR